MLLRDSNLPQCNAKKEMEALPATEKTRNLNVDGGETAPETSQ